MNIHSMFKLAVPAVATVATAAPGLLYARDPEKFNNIINTARFSFPNSVESSIYFPAITMEEMKPESPQNKVAQKVAQKVLGSSISKEEIVMRMYGGEKIGKMQGMAAEYEDRIATLEKMCEETPEQEKEITALKDETRAVREEIRAYRDGLRHMLSEKGLNKRKVFELSELLNTLNIVLDNGEIDTKDLAMMQVLKKHHDRLETKLTALQEADKAFDGNPSLETLENLEKALKEANEEHKIVSKGIKEKENESGNEKIKGSIAHLLGYTKELSGTVNSKIETQKLKNRGNEIFTKLVEQTGKVKEAEEAWVGSLGSDDTKAEDAYRSELNELDRQTEEAIAHLHKQKEMGARIEDKKEQATVKETKASVTGRKAALAFATIPRRAEQEKKALEAQNYKLNGRVQKLEGDIKKLEEDLRKANSGRSTAHMFAGVFAVCLAGCAVLIARR